MRFVVADVLDVCDHVAPESVQTIVTSPPYWGLRDYGVPPSIWGGDSDCDHEWGPTVGYVGHRGNRGQIPDSKWPTNRAYPQNTGVPQTTCRACGAWRGALGLEPTPELYVEHLVQVFRLLREVLRPDGTAWVVLGSTYNGSGGSGGDYGPGGIREGQPGYPGRRAPRWKPKDLVDIPGMVGQALQRDGWWWRSEIVWHKPNAAPESAPDRPSRNHEKVLLLTKSGRPTFWTHPDRPGTRRRPKPDWRWRDRSTGEESADRPGGEEMRLRLPNARRRWIRVNLWRAHDYYYDQDAIREPIARSWVAETNGPVSKRGYEGASAVTGGPRTKPEPHPLGRNRRTVWTIPPSPYPGAHFAVFPPALVEPMILAGSSPRACPACGAPWARNTRQPSKWLPTCACPGNDGSGKCLVLDPFAGTGTTCIVAEALRREAVGIELNPRYVGQAHERAEGVQYRLFPEQSYGA